MICEHFYYFNDMNRTSQVWTLDQVFDWGGDFLVVAMGEEELAYLFSMKLMLGDVPLKSFQEMHDYFWENYGRGANLHSYLGTYPIFCTEPSFIDYMVSPYGDLEWQKKVKERKHWSTASQQTAFFT